MNIFDAFSIFTSINAGVIILAIIATMEFIIKPVIAKISNGHRQSAFVKKTILPIFVLFLGVLGSLVFPPAGCDTLGGIIMFGIGSGLISMFIYRSGLSHIVKKIGIEAKMSSTLFPPKPPELTGDSDESE